MAKIFFSYRRSDSANETKRIYRQFEQSFGMWRFLGAQRRNLFLDKDNITPDGDFRAHIQRFIINSDHMLVIIGDTWLEEIQRRKAENETDFVLIEIELAFIHKVNVIPVLINGARMPSRDDLPPEINQLSTQHAQEIREAHFENDTKQLIKHTRPAVGFHLWGAFIALLLLIGLGFMISDLLSSTNPNPNITQLPEPTEIVQNRNPISADDARATGAAQAYGTLTALAPTPIPTITQTPSNTPISSSDIQLTARAEVFATETILAGIQATDAQITQNAVLTEQFVAGSTATYIAQLTLTPPATPTPNLPEAERVALAGVTTNAEWEQVAGDNGYVQEFAGTTMVLVPTGCFTMGEDSNAYYWNGANWIQGIENGGEQCFDEPFWADKYEVTNEQYGSTGCSEWSWQADQPHNCVTWFDAHTHCNDRDARLPTESEWEYVARGPDDLYYTWGNTLVEDNSVHSGNSGGQIAIVGSYPAGTSWVGAMNMSGNLSEWTISTYAEYPYDANDGREDDSIVMLSVPRVVRGGSFRLPSNITQSTDRGTNFPNSNYDTIGFRCVRDYDE